MDINNLMKQAQAMQRKLEETNKQLEAMQFEADASNGLVKITVNGQYRVVSVDIDETILNKEDKEMIQDLIMIATNNAIDKVDNAKKEKFGSMTQGLKL